MATATTALDAMPPVIVVPGIGRWLGIPDSTDAELEETYEELCERLRQQAIR